MTVAQLIDALRNHPPALRVMVDGYEEGYDDLSPNRILVRRISLDTGTEAWQGKHGDPRDRPGNDSEPIQTIEALVFRRASG